MNERINFANFILFSLVILMLFLAPTEDFWVEITFTKLIEIDSPNMTYTTFDDDCGKYYVGPVLIENAERINYFNKKYNASIPDGIVDFNHYNIIVTYERELLEMVYNYYSFNKTIGTFYGYYILSENRIRNRIYFYAIPKIYVKGFFQIGY